MSSAAALAATFVCVSAVASLVGAEIRRDKRGRFAWKPLASAAFCLVPVLAGAFDDPGTLHHTVAAWVMAGLVLGAVGDLLLMFDDRRAFTGGLCAFLLGHLAYVIAFTRLAPFGHWSDEGVMIGLEIAVGAAAVVVLRWLWPRLGSMRGPVIAYVAVISAMVLAGAAVWFQGEAMSIDARRLIAAGAVAFYASDLAVARDRFVVKDAWNKTIGLPVYYGAQLLIAWSISVR